MPKVGSGIVQLKSGVHAGKWMAKVRLEGFTPAGHPRETRVYRETFREAAAEKKRIESEIARGELSTSRTPFKTYSETWLAEKAGEVKQASLKAYEVAIRVHLWPLFAGIPLGKLDAQAISRGVGALANEKGAKTANHSRKVLGIVLGRAFELGLISSNPITRVRNKKEADTVKVLWSPTDLQKFLAVARGHRLFPAWHLVAVTGLRRGELLGLRWDDLELSSGLLRVAQQIAPEDEKGKGGKRLETPKSKNSSRTLHIDLETVEIIREWRKQQLGEKKLLEGGWIDDEGFGDLVFRQADGRGIPPKLLSEWFRALKKKADVPQGMKLHSMRTLSATFLQSQGFGVVEVAERLGHTPKTLLDHYSATLEGRRALMAVPMSERVRAGQEGPPEDKVEPGRAEPRVPNALN
jgi:integrase